MERTLVGYCVKDVTAEGGRPYIGRDGHWRAYPKRLMKRESAKALLNKVRRVNKNQDPGPFRLIARYRVPKQSMGEFMYEQRRALVNVRQSAEKLTPFYTLAPWGLARRRSVQRYKARILQVTPPVLRGVMLDVLRKAGVE